jgi:hypothetical protein
MWGNFGNCHALDVDGGVIILILTRYSLRRKLSVFCNRYGYGEKKTHASPVRIKPKTSSQKTFGKQSTVKGKSVRDPCKVKVKLSRYRPGKAVGVPGGSGFRICRKSAREGGKVVIPTHRPSLPPRKDSWYSFLLETESTSGLQCDRKNYVTEKFQWFHRESNPRTSDL